MRISAAVLCLLSTSVSVDAFVPVARNAAARGHITLFDNAETSENEKNTKATEKQLREEIAERNSQVENEENYALLDGDKLTAVVVEEEKKPEPVYTTNERTALEAKLERLVKTRAYPLFLAEKAAEVVEGIINGFKKGSETHYPRSGKKEKIVVLGTGWGAASFLKDIIQTLRCDRNFSPQLFSFHSDVGRSERGHSRIQIDYRTHSRD
jgi:hypothetical protein